MDESSRSMAEHIIHQGSDRVTRWMFVFWVGQMAAFVGFMAYLR